MEKRIRLEELKKRDLSASVEDVTDEYDEGKDLVERNYIWTWDEVEVNTVEENLEINVPPSPLPVHWDDELNSVQSDEEQDVELTDNEAELRYEDTLAYLMEVSKEDTEAFNNTTIKYHRGPNPSRSTQNALTFIFNPSITLQLYL